MDKANQVRPGEELDWSKLADYLKANITDLEGDMSVAQFHGGHANLTYLLKFGDRELVLRRPPFGKIAPGAHDMKREYRVLSKLYKHFPQAPRAFHYSEDESVIGARFVVMERRNGIVVRYQLPKVFQGIQNIEQRLTDALMKAIAELHKVDVEAADLTKLGRPEGFLQRQLAGWSKRWELSKIEENPVMDEVMQQLQSDVPIPQAVSIVHNDLKFDNCQYQPDNPDEVTSIFDWDMTTLGDPLVDLGSTLGYWPDPFFDGHDIPVMLVGNFPDKKYLIDKYAEYTGFSMERVSWYESFAYWKGAVIAQQLYHRYVQGSTKDKRMAKFGNAAVAFSKIAQHILNK